LGKKYPPKVGVGTLGELSMPAASYFNSRIKLNVFEELASYQDSINVEFPQGLKTSYANSIQFKQQMQGNTTIITEKLSLLDRGFYQFRKMYNTR